MIAASSVARRPLAAANAAAIVSAAIPSWTQIPLFQSGRCTGRSRRTSYANAPGAAACTTAPQTTSREQRNGGAAHA